MRKLGTVAAVAVAAVLVYLISAQGPASLPPRNPGEPAPALSGKTADGKTASLTDYKGKVVLVDFWATWCRPCQEEIPDLVKLNDSLKDKGFQILGVSMDEEGAKAVKRFEQRQPISYPVILNPGERPPKGWVVPGLPSAYLIGRDGSVLKRWFGEKDIPALRKDVEDALAAKN